MRLSVDSNILVYAVDCADPVRQASAAAIIAALSACDAILTLQSLAEFRYVVARKRIAEAAEVTREFAKLVTVFGEPVPSNLATLSRAVLGWEQGRFSFWDAMLLAAAGAAGCNAVISEDMHEGATLDGVRVIAAFDSAGAVSPAARAALNMA